MPKWIIVSLEKLGVSSKEKNHQEVWGDGTLSVLGFISFCDHPFISLINELFLKRKKKKKPFVITLLLLLSIIEFSRVNQSRSSVFFCLLHYSNDIFHFLVSKNF